MHIFLELDEDMVREGAVQRFMALPINSRIPLIANLAAPIFIGESRLNLVLLLGLEITDENELNLAAQTSSDDVVAALQLISETGLTFSEIITQTTA